MSQIANSEKISVFQVDLASKNMLNDALSGVDMVVHFAGILFKSNPEKFLSETNILYFNNLLDGSIKQGVRKIILISFPHVESESFPDSPSQDSLEGNPTSMHAKTRLEEEKLLFQYSSLYKFEGVSLRVGMVYGRGILVIDAAQ